MLRLQNIQKLYTGSQVYTNATLECQQQLISQIQYTEVLDSDSQDMTILSASTSTMLQPQEFIDSTRITQSADLTLDLTGFNVAPALIDLQVNGANGIIFNRVTTVQELRNAIEAQIADGTTACLPTFITDSPAQLQTFLQLIHAYHATYGADGILGVHLEGPYINPLKRGTHNLDYIRSLTQQDVDELAQLASTMPVLLSLAPEQTTPDMIRALVQRGVIVFAAHSACNELEATQAFQAGVSGVTHLFNAMNPLESRNPNLLAAALNSSGLFISCIPDGYHVNFSTLKVAYHALLGNGLKSKLLAVTDAFSANMPELFSLEIGNLKIWRQNGCYVNSEGKLAGSAISLWQACRNFIQYLAIPATEALRMVSTYPAEVLGLDTYGRIKTGANAELIIFDQQFNLKAVVHHGQIVQQAQ